jgi:hypothetical protein
MSDSTDAIRDGLTMSYEFMSLMSIACSEDGNNVGCNVPEIACLASSVLNYNTAVNNNPAEVYMLFGV